MVTAGAAKAAAVKETAVAAEQRAAAVATEKTTTTGDRAECQQKTKTLLEMRALSAARQKEDIRKS
jgi:hypothetical protein